MEGQRLSLLNFILFHGLILSLFVTIGLSHSDKKSYIVYLGNQSRGGSSTVSLHNNMLQDVFGSDPVAKSVLYSYKRSFNGFVAELTEEEAQKIAVNDNRTAKLIDFFCSVCDENSLNPKSVKGKIVVCDKLVSGSEPLAAGAIGALFQDNTPQDFALSFPLPASLLDAVDGSWINVYIHSTRNATATIFKSDEGNDTMAPYVASFSSRGPNPITPDILKDMELGCFNKLPETTLNVLKQQMGQFRI
ncbi:hypothetical protein V6N11_013945 [Hibiscus sabdariffa]|uniref:Inhibitor I9 domain-containing protein n=1 Tax=Hibiscus sabdariffa TaxID=183260 RepID=A0ABR2A2G9_9ROSI